MMSTIPRSSVSSTNIRSIGYDPKSRTMAVEFHNGGIYHYSDVPPEKHADLMTAPSIGNHLAKNFRGQHSTMKVGY